MSADILTIGRTGLAASSSSLSTASKNISNVNTPGYSRQANYQVASPFGGVGEILTERIVSSFAQYQLRIDTANVSHDKAYLKYAEYVDNVMSSDSNSISTYLDNFYASVHTATNTASISAGRQELLSQAESLVNQFHSMTTILETQKQQIGNELEQISTKANELIENISRLNKEINNGSLAFPGGIPPELYDERDQNILRLSELVEVNVLELENEKVSVMLASGDSLVMADGTFNVFTIPGDPDPTARDIVLANSKSGATIGVKESAIGGELGGLFEVRDDIIDPTLRELGQLAFAMGDAFNAQQHLGMDLDNQIGADIFSFASSFSITGSDNVGDPQDSIEVQLEPGRGGEVTPHDYRVTIGPAATDYTIQAVDLDGNSIGSPATGSFVAGTATSTIDGLSLNFTPNAGAFTVGDEFILQPTIKSAESISLALSRWEDIALASPIRLQGDSSNLGSGKISAGIVTNTDPASSDFTSPGGLTTDPLYIRYTGADTFSIYDSDPDAIPAPAAIATASFASTDYENIMANTLPLLDYGYDFNIDGVPALGDTYTLSYNTDGFDDNRNGNAMVKLQSEKLVRGSINGAANLTFEGRYSSTLAEIGVKTSQTQISLTASSAMLEQSNAWNQSVSGVNLDEEAADLIKFQQAYAASAQVISVSQQIFDTILGAVR